MQDTRDLEDRLKKAERKCTLLLVFNALVFLMAATSLTMWMRGKGEFEHAEIKELVVRQISVVDMENKERIKIAVDGNDSLIEMNDIEGNTRLMMTSQYQKTFISLLAPNNKTSLSLQEEGSTKALNFWYDSEKHAGGIGANTSDGIEGSHMTLRNKAQDAVAEVSCYDSQGLKMGSPSDIIGLSNSGGNPSLALTQMNGDGTTTKAASLILTDTASGLILVGDSDNGSMTTILSSKDSSGFSLSNNKQQYVTIEADREKGGSVELANASGKAYSSINDGIIKLTSENETLALIANDQIGGMGIYNTTDDEMKMFVGSSAGMGTLSLMRAGEPALTIFSGETEAGIKINDSAGRTALEMGESENRGFMNFFSSGNRIKTLPY